MPKTLPVHAIDQAVEMLGRVPLFQGLPRSDLERIARLSRLRQLGAGELVVREGDPGDKFYIVYSGAVEILKERPRGDHERLAVKQAGEAFGEMSLLTDAPRSASVRALEPAEVLAVSREDFDELLGGESLAVRLMRGLARSLRALDSRFAAREAVAAGAGELRNFSRVVQRGLIPRRVPQVDGYEVAAATVLDENGSGQVLWDMSLGSDGAPVLSVMDVKGTALPPAYLLALGRALLREVVSRTEFTTLLQRLNEAIAANMLEELDECIQVGLLRLGQQGVECSIGGEQHGLVVRASGTTEEIAAQGPPLGILPTFQYGTANLKLGPGDAVLLFSETDPRLVRGAGELVDERRQESAARLAMLLQAALSKADQAGLPEQDIAFVLVRKK